MIKGIVKILSIIFLFVVLAVFYLSIFGIRTEKFNNQITENILKLNKKINLNLNEVKYLLDPYNFTINIETKNPEILFEENKLRIENFKTNVSLKSLINNQFSIDDLEIETEEIRIQDIILIARSLKNSPQLFILDTVTKDGVVIANIKLNFDSKGKIKDDYRIIGSVKKAKFNLLNQYKLQNLNFDFDIDKNKLSLKQMNAVFNNIRITSPLIQIKKKKNLFFVNGKIINDNKKFNIQELKPIFFDLFKSNEIKKIEFSSINDFSFNINNNLKFSDLKIETNIDLKQLIFNVNNIKLQAYLPNFVEEMKFENHKLTLDYEKDKLIVKGNGKILLADKVDSLSYEIEKNKNFISFNTEINLKNNLLLIDFLDYEKKAGLKSLVTIKGKFKKDKINFELISLKKKIN